MSYKPRGQRPSGDPEVVVLSQNDLQQKLCYTDIQDISNTVGVSVLFWFLSSRTVGTTERAAAYKRGKENLTAVLTVFADGRKPPQVVIGKSRRPQSFPKNFNPKTDLGVYYYAQSQAWTTQNLCTKQLGVLDRTSQSESRRIVHLIDNCSAHSVDNAAFENIEAIYFPPNLTSVLQPIDAGIGRSFKASFWRLLAAHVLQFINIEMEEPEKERDLSLHEFDEFEIAEDIQLTCAPIDACSAVEDTVNCVLDVGNEENTEHDINEQSETEPMHYEK